MSEQLQAILITVFSTVVANGAVLFPLLKSIVTMAWTKSIEWRDMVNDIKNIKDEMKKFKEETIAKMQIDLGAAHNKIRNLQEQINQLTKDKQ